MRVPAQHRGDPGMGGDDGGEGGRVAQADAVHQRLVYGDRRVVQAHERGAVVPGERAGDAAELLARDDVDVIDCAGQVVSPGFIDVHCHLREPGREDVETIATGARAAAAGGFTAKRIVEKGWEAD